MSENAADPLAWLQKPKRETPPVVCPHCKQPLPLTYFFQHVETIVEAIGAIRYLNVVCPHENCHTLIAVAITGFIPKEHLQAAAEAVAGQQQNTGGKPS